MKCEVCLNLLEEYFDGELAPAEHEQVDAHLITCAGCSDSYATLTAEQELFARYDREGKWRCTRRAGEPAFPLRLGLAGGRA